jgi:hypothetical protein
VASVSRVPGIAAALALIVLPVVAIIIRLIQPGWIFVVLLVASPVLVISYALAVVIAATGFLTSRAAFLLSRVRWRGITAAWIAAASSVLASFFTVDFGDTDVYGSPFTILLGYSTPPSSIADASGLASVIFLSLGIAAFIWLTIEWIAALVQRRKRSTPISI